MKLTSFPDIRPHWLRKVLFVIIAIPIPCVYLAAMVQLHWDDIARDMRGAWRGSEL